MVKLIAIHSIRRREPVSADQKGKHNTITTQAGDTFEIDDEKEARRLIEQGAARQAPAPLPALGKPEPAKVETDPMDKLTDDELKALAADRKVTIKANASRAEMLAALKKA